MSNQLFAHTYPEDVAGMVLIDASHEGWSSRRPSELEEVEEARQVMVEAIRRQDWVMKEERIEALFLEFADSALIFRVRCWIEDYMETRPMRRIIDKMNSALYTALNEAGIGIPFPQRELHLVSNVKVEQVNGGG